MKQLFVSLFLVALASFGGQVAVAEDSHPLNIVQGTTDQVIGRVVSERDTLREEPAKMYSCLLYTSDAADDYYWV